LKFSLYLLELAVVVQRRHRSDNKVNNRKSWVLRNGELVEARWKTVVVGEIIKLENDQFVAVFVTSYVMSQLSKVA